MARIEPYELDPVFWWPTLRRFARRVFGAEDAATRLHLQLLVYGADAKQIAKVLGVRPDTLRQRNARRVATEQAHTFWLMADAYRALGETAAGIADPVVGRAWRVWQRLFEDVLEAPQDARRMLRLSASLQELEDLELERNCGGGFERLRAASRAFVLLALLIGLFVRSHRQWRRGWVRLAHCLNPHDVRDRRSVAELIRPPRPTWTIDLAELVKQPPEWLLLAGRTLLPRTARYRARTDCAAALDALTDDLRAKSPPVVDDRAGGEPAR